MRMYYLLGPLRGYALSSLLDGRCLLAGRTMPRDPSRKRRYAHTPQDVGVADRQARTVGPELASVSALVG